MTRTMGNRAAGIWGAHAPRVPCHAPRAAHRAFSGLPMTLGIRVYSAEARKTARGARALPQCAPFCFQSGYFREMVSVIKQIPIHLVTFCLLCGLCDAAKPAKPNILFLLADDYGMDGVGCYGSDQFKRRTLRHEGCAFCGKAGVGGLKACPALWQEAGPRTEKHARVGWNGRPARGGRRLAGSISRSEPAR